MNSFQQKVLERLDKIISLLETKQNSNTRRLTEDKQPHIDHKYLPNPYPYDPFGYNFPYWYGWANYPKDIYGGPVPYCGTLSDTSGFSANLRDPSTSSSLASGSTTADSNLSDSFFTINTK